MEVQTRSKLFLLRGRHLTKTVLTERLVTVRFNENWLPMHTSRTNMCMDTKNFILTNISSNSTDGIAYFWHRWGAAYLNVANFNKNKVFFNSVGPKVSFFVGPYAHEIDYRTKRFPKRETDIRLLKTRGNHFSPHKKRSMLNPQSTRRLMVTMNVSSADGKYDQAHLL